MDNISTWARKSRESKHDVEEVERIEFGDSGAAADTAGEHKGSAGVRERDEEAHIRATYTRRSYANTYRNKNKERINRLRRERDKEPRGAFNKARRRARGKGQKWNLTFDNWYQAWLACPQIFDDSVGYHRLAWDMRSGDIQKGTQLRRKDPHKPWQVTNIEIIYRNQPIPAHGIVSPWDFKRGKPVLPRSIIDGIAEEKAQGEECNGPDS